MNWFEVRIAFPLHPLPGHRKPKKPGLNSFKNTNMTNVACFHGQHFSCLEGFSNTSRLLAFASILKGVDTLRG